MLLWLWHRLAAASPIQPLAWELPYATGAAVKGKGEKKRKEEKRQEKKKERKRDTDKLINGETRIHTQSCLIQDPYSFHCTL